ncbi:MAG: ANTAR domain-containing protein [Actinomycetota bacterium]|nr:ANTAR domain-containing protein [Actinomycetota bacterium]
MDGTGGFDADDGPTETVREALVHSFPRRLGLDELAEHVANRAIIEHAVGMLMLVYEFDADNAFELLTWGARALDVTLALLATQLTEDLGGRARGPGGLAHCEQLDLRSACDDVLFLAHERVSPVSRRGREP